MGSDWDAIEERLVSHSAERRGALDRRARRRQWLPWVLAPLVLPGIGAGVLLAVLERAGGDFGGWPTGQAVAVVGLAFAVPAVLAGWVARRLGVVEAIAWGLVCVCAEVAMVVGIGFLALGLGPA